MVDRPAELRNALCQLGLTEGHNMARMAAHKQGGWRRDWPWLRACPSKLAPAPQYKAAEGFAFRMRNATTSINTDDAARRALWAAVCLGAEQLASQCTIYYVSPGRPNRHKVVAQIIPSVETWQLVEALSLVSILVRSDAVRSPDIVLFGSTGPIEFSEDREPRFLWVQHGVKGFSGFGGRPDLLVTYTVDAPASANVARVVEAKYVQRLGAATIRAEFGKAYDLRVQSYFIWAYYTPSPKVVASARRLRLDFEELGLDTLQRPDLIDKPAALLSKVAHALEEARKAARFAAGVERASEEIRQKLLGSGEQ